MSCGVSRRQSSDQLWLWLWLWLWLAAVALNRPIALEPPYAAGEALKKKKKKKKERRKKIKPKSHCMTGDHLISSHGGFQVN